MTLSLNGSRAKHAVGKNDRDRKCPARAFCASVRVRERSPREMSFAKTMTPQQSHDNAVSASQANATTTTQENNNIELDLNFVGEISKKPSSPLPLPRAHSTLQPTKSGITATNQSLEGTVAMKSKKNKKRKQTPVDEEPDFLGTALSKTRKCQTNEVPTLYKEDIGDAGLKTKRTTPSTDGNFDICLTKEEKRRRKERQMRFNNEVETKNETLDALSAPLKSSRTGSKGNGKKQSNSTFTTLVGTCQDLEKPYLRLTTYPNPAQVRPLHVLIKSLQHIKCRYIKDEDFAWANEQLKSVRQDITVQGLKNNFVLEVYETHARILSENGDLNEFNQCQTMIHTLTTGLHGDDVSNDDLTTPLQDEDSVLLKQSDLNRDEFCAYRLLYALVQNSFVTRELAQASTRIGRNNLSSDDNNKSCRHAMLVVKAVMSNDYHSFFRLYETAPHLSAYLMDFLVKRVRASAYERITAAYRPTISVEYFREALLFPDLQETREFLKECGAIFVEEHGEPAFWIDCKASKK